MPLAFGSTSTMDQLAHDLANVFQTIRQANDLLADGPPQSDLIAVIARSVDRAERLLGLREDEGTASLREAIDKARSFAADACQLRGGLRFAADFSGDNVVLGLPACELERTFTNLFLNALDAVASSGGAEVRVAIDARWRDGVYEVTVADNGPGISSHLAGELFTPGVTSRGSGRGLGLYIARVSIAACGGSISADNMPQGGARFTLRFPAAAIQ